MDQADPSAPSRACPRRVGFDRGERRRGFPRNAQAPTSPNAAMATPLSIFLVTVFITCTASPMFLSDKHRSKPLTAFIGCPMVTGIGIVPFKQGSDAARCPRAHKLTVSQ